MCISAYSAAMIAGGGQQAVAWDRAARQLVRAIRGERSQRAVSRRLGYRANPVAGWEAGRRFPTAGELLSACERLGHDVPRAFRVFHPPSAAALGTGSAPRVDAWLRELRGGTPVVVLAARMGRSRFAIGRWLGGETQPRLPDFLHLVHVITDRVSDLVDALVPIEAVPELLGAHRLRSAAKRLAMEAPWTEAMLRLMETEGYRALPVHREGYLAALLGLDGDEESAALQRAQEAGVIELRDGRYRDLTPSTIDTQAPPEDVARLRAHWSRVALERAAGPRGGDWLGYNLMSISRDDLEQVRGILRQAFRQLRTLAASSEPVETAALVNLQLVTWDERDAR